METMGEGGSHRNGKSAVKTNEKTRQTKLRKKDIQRKSGSTQERRAGKLRSYAQARILRGRIANLDGCHAECKLGPWAGGPEDVAKMAQRGIAYRDDFIKFDGRRQAMSV